MRAIFSTILLACFAFWFGGFGFYVSVVVPIGTDVLGSARAQGVITQQVTAWLNIFGLVAVFAMLSVALASKRSSSKGRHATLLACAILFACIQAGLFYLHPLMSRMFDVAEMQISDEVKFYSLHRVYLWLSTVQWFAAWGWMVGYVLPVKTLEAGTKVSAQSPQ